PGFEHHPQYDPRSDHPAEGELRLGAGPWRGVQRDAALGKLDGRTGLSVRRLPVRHGTEDTAGRAAPGIGAAYVSEEGHIGHPRPAQFLLRLRRRFEYTAIPAA